MFLYGLFPPFCSNNLCPPHFYSKHCLCYNSMTVHTCGSLSKSLSSQEKLQVRLWLNLLCFPPRTVLYKQWVLNNEMTNIFFGNKRVWEQQQKNTKEAWISSLLNKYFYSLLGLNSRNHLLCFFDAPDWFVIFLLNRDGTCREICTISSRWVSVNGSRYYITQLSIIFLWPHTESKLPLSITIFENTMFEAV